MFGDRVIDYLLEDGNLAKRFTTMLSIIKTSGLMKGLERKSNDEISIYPTMSYHSYHWSI